MLSLAWLLMLILLSSLALHPVTLMMRMQVQPLMARELFPAGFVSCWAELGEKGQEALVRSLEAALASPAIPHEIVTVLLNLAEFMEHDEKSLPLDTRSAVLAYKPLGA